MATAVSTTVCRHNRLRGMTTTRTLSALIGYNNRIVIITSPRRYVGSVSCQLRLLPQRWSRGEVTCTSPSAVAPAVDFCRRGMATGTRGSRGHGWYVNYRAGKGGRHLQDEYFDRPSLLECRSWNQSILAMNQYEQEQQDTTNNNNAMPPNVYFDVVVEPKSSGLVTTDRRSNKTVRKVELPNDSVDIASTSWTGEQHRLTFTLATAVMPETCQNFIDLCTRTTNGYTGTILYRRERNVGICGGDVLTNTGKTGQAAPSTTKLATPPTMSSHPLRLTIRHDPLTMWHIPGTISMMVASVHEIDSRFTMCTHAAPHMDGIHRAFGQMSATSLALIQQWESTLLTSKGVPTSVDLVIVGSGILSPDEAKEAESSQVSDETVTAA